MQIECPELIAAVEKIAAAWEQHGIRHAVLHGLEDYPAGLGRDLDILIPGDQCGQAIAIADSIFRENGFLTVLPPDLWGPRIIAVREDDPCIAMEIHTLENVAWRSVLFTGAPDASVRTGPFPVDPWAAFAKRILVPWLSEGSGRFRRKPHELQWNEGEREAAAAHLPRFFGNRAAEQIMAAIQSSDADRLDAIRGRLKTIVTLRAARFPIRSLKVLARSFMRKLRQPFNPCGPTVAFIGFPDALTAAVLKNLNEGGKSIFTKIVVHHHLAGSGDGASFESRPLSWRLRDAIDSSRQRLIIYEAQKPPSSIVADIAFYFSEQPGIKAKRSHPLPENASPEQIAPEIRKAIMRTFIDKLRPAK